MGRVYQKLMEFNKKHAGSVAWRVKKHCDVIEQFVNSDEEVVFAFAGQKNDSFIDFFRSCVVVLTNRRILIGQKRVVWGKFLSSITPDLYNDLLVYEGLFWGKIVIDTVKEEVTITNLSKSGLDDIETNISQMMMREKQKYVQHEKDN